MNPLAANNRWLLEGYMRSASEKPVSDAELLALIARSHRFQNARVSC
jgi:hypothetical protein